MEPLCTKVVCVSCRVYPRWVHVLASGYRSGCVGGGGLSGSVHRRQCRFVSYGVVPYPRCFTVEVTLHVGAFCRCSGVGTFSVGVLVLVCVLSVSWCR